MVDPQFFMGVAIAALCLVAAAKERWLLTNSRKGQRLIERVGEQQARWVIRAVLGMGVVFGGALAGGLINPVRWN